MFAISNLLIAVARILDIGLSVYMWIIIGRAVVSWVNADPYNPIVRFLYSVTEPVLSAVRRNLPVSYSGFDFSPILVILLIVFLRAFVVQTLLQLAQRLRLSPTGIPAPHSWWMKNPRTGSPGRTCRVPPRRTRPWPRQQSVRPPPFRAGCRGGCPR